LVEFGTARHVIPPSVEVESDVVEAASSEVMGRVEIVVLVVVLRVLRVMVTEPFPLLFAVADVKLPVMLNEPPPPPDEYLSTSMVPPPPPE
jgi:hypothetical protein